MREMPTKCICVRLRKRGKKQQIIENNKIEIINAVIYNTIQTLYILYLKLKIKTK